MKLTVGGVDTTGNANNDYILFDMPENGGVWVGGVEGSNVSLWFICIAPSLVLSGVHNIFFTGSVT